MKKIKNIVFFSGELNPRAGGPSGYLANLQKGLEICREKKVKLICWKTTNRDLKHELKLKRLMTFWVPFKSMRKKFRNWLINRDEVTSDFSTSFKSAVFRNMISELDDFDFETVTCHQIRDVLFIKNYLKSRGDKNAKVIAMSHSPQPVSEEKYISEKLAGDPDAEEHYKKWQELENKAFHEADYLLFPSVEAMEPYEKGLPYFADIKREKNFIYLPTGCNQLKCDSSIDFLREKFGIKTKYVICYIGRHNKIKGYDLLQKIAMEILAKRDDVTFLIGGIQSVDIPPLKDERWKELGFVNPAEVFKVSDCFILPNRETYFDLILLEALSAGCPTFASATGGNKSVYLQTNAIDLYKTEDECVSKVMKFLDSTATDKENKREKALEAYYNNYTIDIFTDNYLKMIEKIGDK